MTFCSNIAWVPINKLIDPFFKSFRSIFLSDDFVDPVKTLTTKPKFSNLSLKFLKC